MNIALICLKKENTRLPGKNFMTFNGTTLFEHTLDTIKETKIIDEIIVCSDDERAKAICNTRNIVFIDEPGALAHSDSVWKVIKFVIKKMSFAKRDVLIYLPCTAPLRTVHDIEAAYLKYKTEVCDSVVGVRECRDPPEWSFPMVYNRLLVKDLKMTSQEHTPHYCINGAIYIACVETLKKHDGYFGGWVAAYVMPIDKSIDIDYEEEFKEAKRLYNISNPPSSEDMFRKIKELKLS